LLPDDPPKADGSSQQTRYPSSFVFNKTFTQLVVAPLSQKSLIKCLAGFLGALYRLMRAFDILPQTYKKSQLLKLK
jgi:hypothetical protein